MKQTGHKKARLLVSLLQSRKKPQFNHKHGPLVSAVIIITKWMFTFRGFWLSIKQDYWRFNAIWYVTGPGQNESKKTLVVQSRFHLGDPLIQYFVVLRQHLTMYS